MSILLAGGAEFPRFDTIQAIGQSLLGLGVLLHLLVQVYRQISGQPADLFAPFARGLLGFVLLTVADDLGAALFDASRMLAEGIAGEANLQGLDRGVEAAFAALSDDFGLSDLVSLRFWVSLICLGMVLFAFMAKFAVIDILWPVYFGLVVMMGGLAIPLSLIPGIETMRGWLLTLIEAALWPVIFQVVVGIMAATVGQGLGEPLRLATEQLDFAPLITALATLATLTLVSLGTPILAATLLRGQTASVMFGRAAGRAALLGAVVGARVADTLARRGIGGAGVATPATSASPGQQRFYNPRGWKADEARQHNALLRAGNADEAEAFKTRIQARLKGEKP